jgi:hypothetical protein
MCRSLLLALCLFSAIAIPGVAVTPAPACGYVRVPVDTDAEIAAIRKALPAAKLTDEERESAKQLLATADKGKAARKTPQFAQVLADTMRALGIERIFRKQSCMTIRIPVVTS